MPSGGRRLRLGDKCIDCSAVLSNYNVVRKGIMEYVQPRCKRCHKIHYNSSPSRTKESRSKYYMMWKWGLTEEEYNKKLELQLNGCAICKQPCSTGRKLAVDHCHKTGKYRDLLCYRCNTVLGLINEDDGYMLDLMNYIKRHSQKVA